MKNQNQIPEGPAISQEFIERELIEMGLKGKLWTLTVEYETETRERKQIIWRNLTETELMNRRMKMFQFGLTVPVGGDPGHWRVVCPFDIIRVDLYKQVRYFKG